MTSGLILTASAPGPGCWTSGRQESERCVQPRSSVVLDSHIQQPARRLLSCCVQSHSSVFLDSWSPATFWTAAAPLRSRVPRRSHVFHLISSAPTVPRRTSRYVVSPVARSDWRRRRNTCRRALPPAPPGTRWKPYLPASERYPPQSPRAVPAQDRGPLAAPLQHQVSPAQ